MKHLPKCNLYIYFQKTWESREKPKKLHGVVLCFGKNVGNIQKHAQLSFQNRKQEEREHNSAFLIKDKRELPSVCCEMVSSTKPHQHDEDPNKDIRWQANVVRGKLRRPQLYTKYYRQLQNTESRSDLPQRRTQSWFSNARQSALKIYIQVMLYMLSRLYLCI